MLLSIRRELFLHIYPTHWFIKLHTGLLYKVSELLCLTHLMLAVRYGIQIRQTYEDNQLLPAL